MLDEPILARLEHALRDGDNWEDAGLRLRRTVGDDEIEIARPFVFGLGYRLLEPGEEERRQLAGCAFGTAVRMNGFEFPPPLAELDASILDAWAEFVTATSNAVARSRFHDLLWERRYANAHVHASEAARAYLELAAGRWSPLDRCRCAVRALEIARSTNNPLLAGEAGEHCVALARCDLATEEWSPGVALRAIEALVALPTDLRPEATRELLGKAAERYGRDPSIAQDIAELCSTLSPPEQREKIWNDQVQVWRDAAEHAGGLARYSLRQRALEIALNHGLKDLADAIRLDLQTTSPDELEWQEFSSDISFTHDEVEQYLATIVSDDSWQQAVRRFGAYGPPTGQVDVNDATVRKHAQAFPLRWLTPTQIIGAHGALVFHAVSEDERVRLERVRLEGLGLVVFAPLAIRALEGIRDRFGAPDEEPLAELLSTGPISSELGRRLASAIGYYWRGDYDAAGHLLAPRLEAAVRHLCVTIEIPVTKPPRGPEPGGVITLGALLDDLEGRMDESWRRYLLHLLADPLGLNLRNDIGHGLVGIVDRYQAALLIHATCHIAQLRLEAPPNS
jgi:hypothetical protein